APVPHEFASVKQVWPPEPSEMQLYPTPDSTVRGMYWMLETIRLGLMEERSSVEAGHRLFLLAEAPRSEVSLPPSTVVTSDPEHSAKDSGVESVNVRAAKIATARSRARGRRISDHFYI